MKLLKSPKNTLIIFLTSIIIVSFFFIVRLEIKAANLQTQWEKHQESLKKNKDSLAKLEVFARYVGKGVIKLDNSGIILNYSDSWLYLGTDEAYIETKGKLRMEASGDIYITSTNGNVNIKGKKVNLNE